MSEREREKLEIREKRIYASSPSGSIGSARLFTRVYARNTCGGKMVSSFRALSFASRVLDEKKRTTRARGGKEERARKERNGVSRSLSLSERRKPREL